MSARSQQYVSAAFIQKQAALMEKVPHLGLAEKKGKFLSYSRSTECYNGYRSTCCLFYRYKSCALERISFFNT